MKNSNYSEKLRDPRWQKRRLEIFQRDNWTCQSCDSQDKNLQVHHIKYIKGLEPWEYEPHYLVTYCEVCHSTDHLIGDQIAESLIEVMKLDNIYIKQVGQLCVLIEKDPSFYPQLKAFLNEAMMNYLHLKKAA